MVKLEIEVDTLEQLAEALRFDIDAVLLDNIGPEGLRRAVDLVHGRAITEASGGITPATAGALAATGVDYCRGLGDPIKPEVCRATVWLMLVQGARRER